MTESTELLRQVNPKFLHQGRPSSQVFKPTAKDDKKLSVYDGDLIAAEAAWQHFTNELGHSSVGVLAVTVGECHSQELDVRPDPTPFPEHAIISFENCKSLNWLSRSSD